MEYVTLNNGNRMPMEGLGVFQVPDFDTCKEAVLTALKTGYRMIDTAAAYANEEAVGQAIRESGIAREEIFIVTKIWVADYGDGKTEKAVKRALEKLGVEYIGSGSASPSVQ